MWNLLLTSQRTSLIVYVKPITQSAIECQSTRERGNGFPSAAESAPARRIPNKAQMLKFWKKTYVLLSCEIRSDFSRREIFELVSTRVDVIEFLRGAPPPSPLWRAGTLLPLLISALLSSEWAHWSKKVLKYVLFVQERFAKVGIWKEGCLSSAALHCVVAFL